MADEKINEGNDGTQSMPSPHAPQFLNLVAGLHASGLIGGNDTPTDSPPPSATTAALPPITVRYSRESRLRAAAEDIMTNYAKDSELSRVLNRQYFQLDRRGRPSTEAVYQAIVETLAQVEDIVPAREAVIALANAAMNSTDAVKHLNNLHRPSTHRPDPSTPDTPSRPNAIAPAATGALTPGAKSTPGPTLPSVAQDGDAHESASSHQIAKNKDDGLPCPEHIAPFEVTDPDGPGNILAVFHHQIRRYLIERDIELYGEYHFKRARGTAFEDQTAPHPDQLDWRFDERENFPEILFQWRRGDHQDPTYPVPLMYWRDYLVVDTDTSPIRNYHHIPSTLSRQAEAGLLEALERMDSRVRHQDLAARQVRDPLEWPTYRQLKNDDNRLAQQMRRFREYERLTPWSDKRIGSKTFVEGIERDLSATDKANNTTKNLKRLTQLQCKVFKRQNAGQHHSRSRNKSEEKRRIYLAHMDREIERLQEAEAKERRGSIVTADDKVESPSELDCSSESEIEPSPSPKPDPEPEPRDGRELVPVTEEDFAAIRQALEPTFLHYAAITGQMPHRKVWNVHYWALYLHTRTQLNVALGKPRYSRDIGLIGYGKWTGPISNYTTAQREENPDMHPDLQ